MVNGNEKLLYAAKNDTEKLLKQFNNTKDGFNNEQVEKMRDEYGKNVITHQEKNSAIKKIIKAFLNPFTIILLVLAIVMIVTDVILEETGSRDYSGALIVFAMVTMSGTLSFYQDMRQSKAAEKLKSLIITTTCVIRNKIRIEIPIGEIVVGDIICLSAGDMVSADMRVLTSKDFFISESSLTGESNPVEKKSDIERFDHMNSLELTNLVFMGSNVISGSATCLVITIGNDTHLGHIAKTLTTKKTATSFEKGVSSVSWLLIRFMAIMVPVVFVINGLTKGVVLGVGAPAWSQALLFGLAVAVGLTPEMLPMIVTAGLAKGSVRLSKKKTIVKNINSIQNFGAIDILCTDKTGTLTEDEIALEKYLNINAKEDKRILRHAFLNSYYQTGVKNIMDRAILARAKEYGLEELVKQYEKIDEIPFDFTRRRMSVVIKDSKNKLQLITKGAVEEMLSICSYAEYDKVVPLTEKIKNKIIKTVEKLNNEGMRVLAVAQKNNCSTEGLFSVQDEKDMVLIGYLAFLDPPKASAKDAIKALDEYGIKVKILTGDNLSVTKCIARQVGLDINNTLVGSEITLMTDEELSDKAEEATIFAKLTPEQKTRIVNLLKRNNHVVGFMGDGINDASALREADVGISVDSAVDIAKESADIILLEKDLMILEEGIIEGRKTFANIIKYIKITASSNFGNVLTVLVASTLIPFLPMLPLQILLLNLIYNISCIAIPWDNVDAEYIKKPKKWEAKSIGKFMLWIGPISSIFDIMIFILMLFIIAPRYLGFTMTIDIFGSFNALTPNNQLTLMAIFQAGWFVLSLWTQTLVIHMIRTPKMPFIQSRASWPVIVLTSLGIIIGTIIPFTSLGEMIGMRSLPANFFIWLIITAILYMILVTVVKNFYIRRYKELL